MKAVTEMRHFAANGNHVELAYGSKDGWFGYTKEDYNRLSPLRIERSIRYRVVNPSLHECSGKCINATGPSCECQCGGSNHGSGNH